MKSMTGYGRAKQELHGRTITAELRAVNHRYLDCTVKAPRQYGFLDDAVKKAAAARIARGKVEVYIRRGAETQEGGDIAVTVNHAVAEHYLAALHELADRYGLRDDVSVMSLAKLPDVLGSERIEQDADEMTRDVLSVFGEACDNFDEMRTREGAKLAEDVRNRASEIERMVGEVEVRSPERVRGYREKLLARMKGVLADTSIDETRIVTEAAIYADKTAVDEETVRLRSHVSQLRRHAALRSSRWAASWTFSCAGGEPREQHHRLQVQTTSSIARRSWSRIKSGGRKDPRAGAEHRVIYSISRSEVSDEAA